MSETLEPNRDEYITVKLDHATIILGCFLVVSWLLMFAAAIIMLIGSVIK